MKWTKPSEFDKKFDEGKEDIIDELDLSTARRINQITKRITKRINVDFPPSVVNQLDAEAGLIGITRQSLIKDWIDERLAKAQAGINQNNDPEATT